VIKWLAGTSQGALRALSTLISLGGVRFAHIVGQAYGVGEIGTCMYRGYPKHFTYDVRVSTTTVRFELVIATVSTSTPLTATLPYRLIATMQGKSGNRHIIGGHMHKLGDVRPV
jgi:hypothetical protein